MGKLSASAIEKITTLERFVVLLLVLLLSKQSSRQVNSFQMSFWITGQIPGVSSRVTPVTVYSLPLPLCTASCGHSTKGSVAVGWFHRSYWKIVRPSGQSLSLARSAYLVPKPVTVQETHSNFAFICFVTILGMKWNHFLPNIMSLCRNKYFMGFKESRVRPISNWNCNDSTWHWWLFPEVEERGYGKRGSTHSAVSSSAIGGQGCWVKVEGICRHV